MEIKTVGVVGCGLMGSGIAQVCAEAEYNVIVREVNEDLLKKGLGRIESFLAKGVEKGKLTLLRLPERIGEAGLPEGVVVDLRAESPSRLPGGSLLSARLRSGSDVSTSIMPPK